MRRHEPNSPLRLRFFGNPHSIFVLKGLYCTWQVICLGDNWPFWRSRTTLQNVIDGFVLNIFSACLSVGIFVLRRLRRS